MQPDLVIFDCDDVLIDSEAISCRMDLACFADVGIAISAEEIMDQYLGISAGPMCADIALRYGQSLPDDFAATLHRRIEAAFEAELAAISGTEAALAALPLLRCVASGSSPQRLHHALSLTGLLSYFDPHVSRRRKWRAASPRPTCSCLPLPQSEWRLRSAW